MTIGHPGMCGHPGMRGTSHPGVTIGQNHPGGQQSSELQTQLLFGKVFELLLKGLQLSKSGPPGRASLSIH